MTHTGIPTRAQRFDPLAALDGLLSEAGLVAAETGGAVSFAGQDPAAPTSTWRTRPGRREQRPCWPVPTSWSTTIATARWSAVVSSHISSRKATQAWCRCQSPAMAHAARGRTVAGST
jgi:hypothetical protein